MKKIILSIVAVMAFASSAFALKFADSNRPISFEELPAAAQDFVRRNFSEMEHSYIDMERELFSTEYTIIFTDGSKIQFDEDGLWEDIDFEYTAIPDSAIPAKILSYVKAKFPKDTITDIERKRNGFEVQLKNKFDLEFNKQMEFVRVD